MLFLYEVIGQTHLLFLFIMQLCGSDLYNLYLLVANSDAKVMLSDAKLLSFKANSRQNLIPEPSPKAAKIKINILISPSDIWTNPVKNTFHRS